MQSLFSGIYQNKNVLLTGHTGFKGSWLAFWLKKMGANVIGYSLSVPTKPNHFELLQIDMNSVLGDMRDREKLNKVFSDNKIDIVFHLAAQSLVRKSYKDPADTFETNIIGTFNVLEASKKHRVKAIINITSDKVYENNEWIWGYKETDKLGGYDPYSASKACADILATSYRNSFLNVEDFEINHKILLATCRAGNVIGGGDWAKDRLMSNIVANAAKNRKTMLRNPLSIRPWQHVLEALSGYLLIGQNLLEKDASFAEAWNFGPNEDENLNVESALKLAKKYWDKIDYDIKTDKNQPHEAMFLKLDSSKARFKLQWKSVWNAQNSFEKTISWYKNYYENGKILTNQNLEEYVKNAKEQKIVWAN